VRSSAHDVAGTSGPLGRRQRFFPGPAAHLKSIQPGDFASGRPEALARALAQSRQQRGQFFPRARHPADARPLVRHAPSWSLFSRGPSLSGRTRQTWRSRPSKRKDPALLLWALRPPPPPLCWAKKQGPPGRPRETRLGSRSALDMVPPGNQRALKSALGGPGLAVWQSPVLENRGIHDGRLPLRPVPPP